MSCSNWAFVTRAIGFASLLLVAGIATAGEPARLTRDGRLKRDPRFVEAGRAVVYSAVESPILMQLVRLDLAGGAAAPLHPQADSSQFEAAFSPDGRYCAFVEFRGVTNVKLLIRDTRQRRDALFDPGADRAHVGNPAIDARRRRVVFSLPRTVGQQLVSVNFQGGDLRYLTSQSEAIDDWAAVAPDGGRLAFGSSRDGDFEIYLAGPDGGDPRRLTTSPGLDIRPAWSPDGRHLAFTSMRDGNYEIYVAAVDGSRLRRVTNHPERDDFAQWHPDGHKLLTVSERAGQFDLYLWDLAQIVTAKTPATGNRE
jgi:Tol biopolymer transport system component